MAARVYCTYDVCYVGCVGSVKSFGPVSCAVEETIVITPLGWERTRAVLPAEWLRAHRVYILFRPDFRYNRGFVEKVAQDLRAKNVEVLTRQVEATREFESLLVSMSNIVRAEWSQKNRVHINISSSGKIAAAAAFLTAAYHSERVASVFYALPSKYTVEDEEGFRSFMEQGLSLGLARMQYLPLFKLEKPNETGEVVLADLYRRGPLSYVDILQILQANRIGGFERFELAPPRARKRGAEASREKWIARLKRQVLNELLKDGYVRLKPSHEGRKILIETTDMGKYAAMLSGLVDRPYP